MSDHGLRHSSEMLAEGYEKMAGEGRRGIDRSESGVSDVFEPEALKEMEEVFRYFDMDHDGRVTMTELGSILRSLGFSPSEAELSRLERSMERGHGGLLSWREFVAFVGTHVAPLEQEHSDDPAKIEEAFEIFGDLYRGGDEGVISKKDLERIITETGEPLDARSFSYMLRVAPPDKHGNIKYETLVEAIAKGARRGD